MSQQLLEEISTNLAVIEEGRRFDKNYKDGKIVHSDGFFGDVRYDKHNHVLTTNVVNDHAEMNDDQNITVQFFKDFTNMEYADLAKITESAFKKNKEMKKFIAKRLYSDNNKSQFRLLRGLSFLGIEVYNANSIDVWYTNGEFDYGAVVTINKQLKYKIKREI